MSLQIWLYWIAGVSLGGAGAFLVFWGLFSDRFSGNSKKRRCHWCWYDMASVAGLKCPECGRAARNEKRLHRSRHRWSVAAAGLTIMLVGAGSNYWALGRQAGWSYLLPLSVQVRLAPILGAETVLFNALYSSKSTSDADLRARVVALAASTLQSQTASLGATNRAREVLIEFAANIAEKDRKSIGLLLISEFSQWPESSNSNGVDAIILLLGQDRALAEVVAAIGPSPSQSSRFHDYMFRELKRPISDAAAESMADIMILANRPEQMYMPNAFEWSDAHAFYARLVRYLDTQDPAKRAAVRALVERHRWDFRRGKSMFATQILQDVGMPYP